MYREERLLNTHRQWLLARTPPGGLPVADDFTWREGPVPDPGPGQLLARTIYLSLDPYQWGRRRRGEEKPGEACHGRTVSQVLKSNSPDYAEGDFIFNTNGWCSHGLTGEGVPIFTYMFPRKLDLATAPISTAVGVLGMLGLTAYSGLVLQCQPRAGETVVVSAASGGVGQVVGQVAKILGCRVVGVAGREEKCAFVTDELGFDACVSHLSNDLAGDLRAACPDGIDIYFENVGGKTFEAVLGLLNKGARITRCGLISQYGNTSNRDPGELWLETGQAVFERLGCGVFPLVVRNFVADHQDTFLARMAEWLKDGRVTYREDIRVGLETTPKVFREMLEGGNFGKTLIRISPDPTRGSEGRAGGVAH
jgi:NADPH-dependent curcumin reductase CurA